MSFAPPEPRHDAPGRAWTIVPFGVAALFALATLVALVAPDLRLRAGPLRVSFNDASRLALQAALATLVAVVLAPRVPLRTTATTLAIGLVLLAAIADSTPRRVGDGAEYVTMALQMRHGRPPAASPGDLAAAQQRLDATPGFDGTLITQPALAGRDGAQDFAHFWLYSAVAAPWLAVTDALGAHLVRAFTVVNALLLLGLAWLLCRRGDDVAAVLVAAGPLVWWVDKAHAEIFLATLLAAAACLIRRHPAAALACAGLAAAQNPATAAVLAALAVVAWQRREEHGPRTAAVAIGTGIGLALLHPLYYGWHLGRWSPLADAVASGLPGLRAMVTPLVDPNLGLLPNALPWSLLALAGVAATPARLRWAIGSAVAALLVVCATTPNVNHGGTPGMSRYGLWILAVATPMVCASGRWLRGRPAALAVVLVASVLVTWTGYRPTLAELSGGGPSWLATQLWMRWPAVDTPLPEVFAERTSRVDGLPPVPVAIEGCTKVLVRGDGTEAWWPFPCAPSAAPPECTAAGALCYVDGSRFTVAPRQPRFGFEPVPERAWTATARGSLPDLAAQLGEPLRSAPLDRAVRVETADDIALPLIVEGPAGAVIWVRLLSGAPSLTLRLAAAADLTVRDVDTGAAVDARHLPAGRHTLPLGGAASLLVVLTDVP